MKVKVIDAPMGAGKTCAMINYMNAAPEGKSFMFVTPYLDEVKRVRHDCHDKLFREPEATTTKLQDLKLLLADGRNIVTTHALFDCFDEETVELVRQHNYTLVMDEVHNVVDRADISRFDAKTIFSKYTEVHQDGTVEWTAKDYEGKFEGYRKLIEEGRLCSPNKQVLVWLFPTKVFEAFEDVFVLTYMFDAQMQRYYFDMFNIEYEPWYVIGDSVETYEITDEPQIYDLSNLRKLVKICKKRNMNKIGSNHYDLSKAWYYKHLNDEDGGAKKIRNNMYTFFRRIANSSSKYNLWTSFIDYKKDLTGEGYAKGFLACNARATNQYRHKTAVAYPINRFVDPNIKSFFAKKGIRIDEDRFALSELLQFIWRSAIRDGKPIHLYIPSRRMRDLLTDWLDEEAGIVKE